MKIRNLKIATRTVLCFSVLALATISLGLFGLSQLSIIRDQALILETNSMPSIIEADNLALQLARARMEVLRLVAMPDLDTRISTESKLKRINDEIDAAFNRYQPLLSSIEERQKFDSLHRVYQDYVKRLEQLKNLVALDDIDTARAFIKSDMAGAGAQMNEISEALRFINLRDVHEASVSSDKTYWYSKVITFFAVLLSLVFSVVIAWRFTLSLAQPITQAVIAAKTIANGDLTQSLDVRGTDEPALLLQAMKLMQNSLLDTISHLEYSSTQLASSAEEMSSVMQESAKDMLLQRTEIEMAATAINEMSQAVEEVANNATSTSIESQKAAEIARQGQSQLETTLIAIETLTVDVLDAQSRAHRLAEQTTNITNVLDVIRSVADQTNLLALNAAIEAARAGDAGRGFAVVADEVRALAHRTSESTREIESMIVNIQTGTAHTVEALESSAEQANLTRIQAQSASQALTAIAKAVSGIDELNLVIASSAEEQAQVSREVDRNIIRIRDLSLQTASGSEQTRDASQQLSELASVLNAQVRKFRV
ncbi:HAMP domain-containing protein [Pseudomonas sp. PA-6-1D]|nr:MULTISPECIES: methyl-accepting chemotaxis protein [unclassified Pseudomonas]MCF5143869.1 HAMP domain-containing protein [Pseudomonas sp. PA-6-3C]MCF5150609.1 HAMP domain-containing protein [Pseudomonas sp. PA-6-3F]MCF5159002.1 HAMP domain-containing protein [Pseudomonas sp. PA-6-2E]MCF5178442.1 HAMP domain-containing protein [Pseudomonas sp. PA-6-1D]MCF5195740.1 HAMP domain-containing protein [Pseudomonas sp. PA-6-1H]